jgi:signal transduction histidine kinase
VIGCDHDRIVQVLANLISNAMKFTDEGGQVRMSASRTAQDVDLSVTDSGIGIPETHHTVIFERLRRIGTKDSPDQWRAPSSSTWGCDSAGPFGAAART